MDFLVTFRDFALPLFELVSELWLNSRSLFLQTFLLALMLGGLSWWIVRWISLNVNRQFFRYPWRHAYCIVVALVMVSSTMLFVSLRYMEPVAKIMVAKWGITIKADTQWSSDTFRKAYEAVYALRDATGKQLEDFTNYPHPDAGRNHIIPTSHEASQQAAAHTYAREAITHFHSHHPFLSKILWAHPDAAQTAITEDVKRVFARMDHNTYPASEAVRLAGEMIRKELQKQAPRVVLISRIALIVIVLLVQTIAIGLLIRSALADIQEKFN